MGKTTASPDPCRGAALTFRNATVHAAFLAVEDHSRRAPRRGPGPILID